jgi:hypothetical protein
MGLRVRIIGTSSSFSDKWFYFRDAGNLISPVSQNLGAHLLFLDVFLKGVSLDFLDFTVDDTLGELAEGKHWRTSLIVDLVEEQGFFPDVVQNVEFSQFGIVWDNEDFEDVWFVVFIDSWGLHAVNIWSVVEATVVLEGPIIWVVFVDQVHGVVSWAFRLHAGWVQTLALSDTGLVLVFEWVTPLAGGATTATGLTLRFGIRVVVFWKSHENWWLRSGVKFDDLLVRHDLLNQIFPKEGLARFEEGGQAVAANLGREKVKSLIEVTEPLTGIREKGHHFMSENAFSHFIGLRDESWLHVSDTLMKSGLVKGQSGSDTGGDLVYAELELGLLDLVLVLDRVDPKKTADACLDWTPWVKRQDREDLKHVDFEPLS